MFGTRLRAYRLSADLSQREVARRVGMDVGYLSKVEAELVLPPSDDKIRRLGAVLGLSPSDVDALLELAHETKLPTDVVNAALIRNPAVGGLLRRLRDRRLSEEQIAAMLEIADRAAAEEPGGDAPTG